MITTLALVVSIVFQPSCPKDLIRDSLKGLHWDRARPAELAVLEGGFVKLAKLDIATLRKAVKVYLDDDAEAGAIPEDLKACYRYHRAIDVAILSRLVFAPVAGPKSSNWYGPCSSLSHSNQPWHKRGEKWELELCEGITVAPMAGYAALEEFDDLSKIARRHNLRRQR